MKKTDIKRAVVGENCISSKEPQVLRYFKDSDLEKIKHVFGCVVYFIIRSFLPLKRDTQNSQVSEHKTLCLIKNVSPIFPGQTFYCLV